MTGPLPHREIRTAYAVWRAQRNMKSRDFAMMLGCSTAMLQAVQRGHCLIPYGWLTRVPEELVSDTEIAIRKQRLLRINEQIRDEKADRYQEATNIVDINKRKAVYGCCSASIPKFQIYGS